MGAKYKHRRIGGMNFFSGTTVAANLVRFFGYVISATELAVVLLIPYNCTIQNLRTFCRLAPGAGETYDYMVRLGPIATGIMADTALASQTAGALNERSDDLVSQVAADEGDLVCIRITTSAGSAVATHTVSVQLIPR